MSVPAAQSIQLHCHHCQRWLGESPAPLTFVGMFKEPQDRTLVPEPRDTRRCKSCGWVNVFRAEPSAAARRSEPSGATRDWRTVELKQG